MKRMIGVCAVAVVAVGSLTACGGGSSDSAGNASGGTSSETSSEGGDNGAGGGTGDYCAAVQDAKQKFGSVSFNAADLGDAVNTIHEIAGQAPDSVSAEWATVDDALTQFVNALADAGLDPSDLTNSSAVQSLAADPQKLHELQKISKSFDSQALTDAGNKIDDEVKADCGFSLSASH